MLYWFYNINWATVMGNWIMVNFYPTSSDKNLINFLSYGDDKSFNKKSRKILM